MNFNELILIFAFISSALLGAGVFATNMGRCTNKAFLLFSSSIAGWSFATLLVFRSSTPSGAEFWIRTTSAIGAFVPVGFSLLRTSIVGNHRTLRGALKSMPRWLLVYLGICVYCFSSLYVAGATLRANGIPDAVQGSFPILFPLYMLGGMVLSIFLIVRDLRRTTGLAATELQFVALGIGCIIGAAIYACIMPLVAHHSQAVSFVPLWIVGMDAIIAYGIATRRILSVGTLVRRAFSYVLLLVYLGAIYSTVFFALEFGLRELAMPTAFFPHLAGAVVTAISMGRAQNLMQAFARRLFINLHQVDLRATLREADKVLHQVATTDVLLERFTAILSKAAGTEVASVYMFQDTDVAEVWSTVTVENLALEDPLVMHLMQTAMPFSLSTLQRRRVSPETAEAAEQLRRLPGALALPLRAAGNVAGVVVVGERLSGRLYDAEEQEALQLLINRLATSLENARLYTELRQSKVYVETLLNELTIGVIAADQRGRLTVCNREAARLLSREATEVVGSGVEALPTVLISHLREALTSDRCVRDENILLEYGSSETIPIRFSTKSLAGSFEGALLVVSDLTQVRRLEEQLRRADRLSSLGTMAAGIAHEIKNPLQPIRTFVSLLPERSGDSGFIERFSHIVGHETARIESLVVRLLALSRPSAPERSHVGLHELVDGTLTLLNHDLNKREIEVEKTLEAQYDTIFVDRAQIEQVLLNVLLNASEAMPNGGTLSLESHLVEVDGSGANDRVLELLVKDEGPGVPPDMLASIFDPFVTTKATGTGLGLSIAYGIVTDHGGTIEINNTPAGAVVQIRLPLQESEILAA